MNVMDLVNRLVGRIDPDTGRKLRLARNMARYGNGARRRRGQIELAKATAAVGVGMVLGGLILWGLHSWGVW